MCQCIVRDAGELAHTSTYKLCLLNAVSALGRQTVAGFFENKEADAKARGQKLPKKKDPKQEYDNFLKSIAEDVQEVEARQDVEAVEAAQDKADQEAFEHG